MGVENSRERGGALLTMLFAALISGLMVILLGFPPDMPERGTTDRDGRVADALLLYGYHAALHEIFGGVDRDDDGLGFLGGSDGVVVTDTAGDVVGRYRAVFEETSAHRWQLTIVATTTDFDDLLQHPRARDRHLAAARVVLGEGPGSEVRWRIVAYDRADAVSAAVAQESVEPGASPAAEPTRHLLSRR